MKFREFLLNENSDTESISPLDKNMDILNMVGNNNVINMIKMSINRFIEINKYNIKYSRFKINLNDNFLVIIYTYNYANTSLDLLETSNNYNSLKKGIDDFIKSTLETMQNVFDDKRSRNPEHKLGAEETIYFQIIDLKNASNKFNGESKIYQDGDKLKIKKIL